MSNYCVIDLKSNNNRESATMSNSMCKDNSDVISKYSDNVKSINDVIPCTEYNSNTPSNNLANVLAWNCTDRGSCNMGDGSYQKWQTYLRRS